MAAKYYLLTVTIRSQGSEWPEYGVFKVPANRKLETRLKGILAHWRGGYLADRIDETGIHYFHTCFAGHSSTVLAYEKKCEEIPPTAYALLQQEHIRILKDIDLWDIHHDK